MNKKVDKKNEQNDVSYNMFFFYYSLCCNKIKFLESWQNKTKITIMILFLKMYCNVFDCVRLID